MPFSAASSPYPISDKVHIDNAGLFDLRKKSRLPFRFLVSIVYGYFFLSFVRLRFRPVDTNLPLVAVACPHIQAERFADFDLNYYQGEARACMEVTLKAARTYAEHFSPDSGNLLLQGGTGLGKTFLSRCIARTVAAQGCSVVYETAQEAFTAFEDQKFSRDAETYAAASERVQRILNADLLILDDLGTELTTSFTQSALYYIVNTRLTDHRKTVISTNLTDGELAARYLPQIASRIGGEYDTLLFLGEDIRAIKKQQRYQ